MISRRLMLAAVFLHSPAMAQDTIEMPLHSAAEANDVATVKRLIASGANLEARDNTGRTALLAATHANAIAAAAELISAGADVNAKDNIDDTPYLYAAAEGRLEILRMTLEAGADLKDTNRYGGTGLIPAAHHGYPDIVRELLKTDIDIDHVNRLGWTALLEAIVLSDGGPAHQDIVAQLIAAGGDVNLGDAEGVGPLAHARQRGFAEIVTMLEQAGAR